VESVTLDMVSGFDNLLLGSQSLKVTVSEKAAYFSVRVELKKDLESLSMDSSPAKIDYVEGDTIDLSGLVVTGVYAAPGGNETVKIPTSEITVTGFDSSTAGAQTVTISCGGKSQSFSVNVGRRLVSIALNSPAAKYDYYLTEWPLDITGLTINKIYNSGPPENNIPVALGDISPAFNSSTSGRKELTITIGGCTLPFIVYVCELASIDIWEQPTQVTYPVGAAVNYAGMIVRGNYALDITVDETPIHRECIRESIPSTDYTMSPLSNAAPGSFPITVTYSAKSIVSTAAHDPFQIQFYELASISVLTPPDKLEYIRSVDLELDLSGLSIQLTYTDLNTSTVSYSLANASSFGVTGFDSSTLNTLGSKSLGVTYGGKTTSTVFTITVVDPAGIGITMDDPIGGIIGPVTLSKSGSGYSKTQVFTVTAPVTGSYSSYAWFINESDTPASTASSYTLDAADCRLGANTLRIRVQKNNGAYYDKEIAVTVER
jgi:hypothetical protein